VIIACRSAERARAAIADIERGGEATMAGTMEYTPLDANKVGTISAVELDLADLTSVERCAAEILNKEGKIDVLFANAGIMAL